MAASLAPATALSGWYVIGSNSPSFHPNTGNWSSGVSWEHYRFFPYGCVYWDRKLAQEPYDGRIRPIAESEAVIMGPILWRTGAYIWSESVRASRRIGHVIVGRGGITMAGTNYYQNAPCNGYQLSGLRGNASYTAVGCAKSVVGSRFPQEEKKLIVIDGAMYMRR